MTRRVENPQIGWLWVDLRKDVTTEQAHLRSAVVLARHAIFSTLGRSHGVRAGNVIDPRPSPMEPKNNEGYWKLLAVRPEHGITHLPDGVMPSIRQITYEENDKIFSGHSLDEKFEVPPTAIEDIRYDLQIVPEDFAYSHPLALWTPHHYSLNREPTVKYENYWPEPQA